MYKVLLQLRHTEILIDFDKAVTIFEALQGCSEIEGYGDSRTFVEFTKNLRIEMISAQDIKTIQRRQILES